MSATCPVCGRKVRTVAPAGGDGSVDVYVRHTTPDGARCDASRREVDEDSAS